MKNYNGDELDYNNVPSPELVIYVFKFCIILKEDGSDKQDALTLVHDLWDLMIKNGVEHTSDFLDDLIVSYLKQKHIQGIF